MSLLTNPNTRDVLDEILAQRILLLDGSMGALDLLARPERGGLPRRALPQPPELAARTAPRRWS